MATSSGSARNQIPLNRPIAINNGLVTQPWAFWLQQFVDGLPAAGSGFVIDGTADAYGPMTISQGPAVNRGSSPTRGSIYFATDTGQTFTEAGGAWQSQGFVLTGDVTKSSSDTNTTLANVNPNFGTYGNTSTVPIITVNAKGLITSVSTVPITVPAASAGGVDGQVQINLGGSFSGSSDLVFSTALHKLTLTNLGVGGVITFSNPILTFNNLSPLTTKGDVLGYNGTTNVRKAAGTDGQLLVADSTTVDGLKWTSPADIPDGTYEIPWHFGDASPEVLYLVPAGKTVYSVSLVIQIPMNDAAATLSIGSTASPTELLDTSENLPTEQGTYSATSGTKYSVATQLYLTISPGASTQGSGLVVVEYQQ